MILISDPKEIFLSLEESIILRERYITSFIDTEGPYYKNHIVKNEDGYFWDCFNSPKVIEYGEILKSPFLTKNVYVLWDKRSYTPLLHFNIEQVLMINMKELLGAKNKYTEDIYIFDNTFSWTYALTHEKNDYGDACVLNKKEKAKY